MRSFLFWSQPICTLVRSENPFLTSILSTLGRSHYLTPHCTVDPDVWVNASLSLGIGWAESMALKLVVFWLVEQNFSDCNITIWGVNTGVIGAFNKGHSCNTSWNDTIHRIASCLIPFNITIVPVFVTSLEHRANSVSHSILGPQELCLGCSFKLPQELCSCHSHVWWPGSHACFCMLIALGWGGPSHSPPPLSPSELGHKLTPLQLTTYMLCAII